MGDVEVAGAMIEENSEVVPAAALVQPRQRRIGPAHRGLRGQRPGGLGRSAAGAITRWREASHAWRWFSGCPGG